MECRCGGELRKFDQPTRVETWFCSSCGSVVARLAQRPERFRGKEEASGSNPEVGLWKS
jgi:ribosomal protein L37AE/L43A